MAADNRKTYGALRTVLIGFGDAATVLLFALGTLGPILALQNSL